MSKRSISLIGLFSFAALSLAIGGNLQAQDVVKSANGITTITVKNTRATVDFVHAKPMPMPEATISTDAAQAILESIHSSNVDRGGSGGAAGNPGTGSAKDFAPVFLGKPELEQNDQATPEDYGTSGQPFTTVRADLFGLTTTAVYPYRAAGKLFFNEPSGTYMCTASLIKPGIVVTAAHCVANFGKSQYYSGWQFIPSYANGVAPYGKWSVTTAIILTSYFNGTDPCAQSGVVCQDDVALLVLSPQSGRLVGSTVGWYGYTYGGGFTSGGLGQITQLGYPAGLDNAAYMERTDSQAYTSASSSNNHIIGSNQNGGSSGGPWVENLGLTSTLTGETNGSFPSTNNVVGVTSWGSTSLAVKNQGAAPFTSGNIQVLVTYACAHWPGDC